MVDFLDTDNKPENIILKRAGCDKELGVKILDIWSEVLTNLPSSWEKCSVFERSGVQSLFRNDAQRQPPRAADTSAPSKIAMSVSTTAELQALLDAHTGDSGYVMQSRYSEVNGSCWVPCINARQKYQCPTSGDTHTSNNAYLVFSKGHVWYQCHTEKCAGEKWKVGLGEIPVSFMELSGIAVYSTDAEQYAKKVTRMLSRELLLQGHPRSAVDVLDVLSDTIAILASGDVTAEQKTIIFATFNEWIARSDLLLDNTLFTDIDASIATARETQKKDAADNAFNSLHCRRMANPLLVFRYVIVHKTDESVHGVLKNTDTALTDCRLVLYARKMWPNAKHEVFTFICLKYPENAPCNEEKFEDVWQIGTARMPYAKTHLNHYTTIALSSDAFIRSTLPAIMQSPIFSYSQKDDETLHFTLDAPPLLKPGKQPIRAEFTLEYATSDITGLNRQGTVHNMYSTNLRAYFAKTGGVNGMATLLYDENIGSIMKYDESAESWRMYCATTGIWKLPVAGGDIAVAIAFMQKSLLPIVSLVDFLGAAQFDWVTGEHEPMPDLVPEDDDDECEDADSPVKKKQKRLVKSSTAGEHSLRRLETAITLFVQVKEVLGHLKSQLHAPFDKCLNPDRVACPNGVINLRSGKLLPIAKPDDLFTSACPTQYNLEVSVDKARQFFENFFPVEYYTDCVALVFLLQMWFGYCLTGCTQLSKCLWLFGDGANGKSIIIEMLKLVLGTNIHAEIPMASLCKGRGENNDALFDARGARLITVSESDTNAKISEGAFKSIVSGEDQHIKTMWKKGTTKSS